MVKLLTLGTFDTPHMGHACFLKYCERYGEVVVGLNSDEFVLEYKKEKPVFSYEERGNILSGLGYKVVKNNSAGRECIIKEQPDILAIGSDWARKDYYNQIDVTQDFLDRNNIQMLYIPYTQGISTTLLKERLGGKSKRINSK